MSLTYVGEQITLYLGSFLVVTGVIGNGINILVFSTVRSYRTTPCTFYFLIGSLFDIAYIMINLVSRIVISGAGVDLTRTSVSWCKIRTFCLVTLSLSSLSCSCLATIDQFFITSQNGFLRRLSSIKWAPRILCILIIVWCCHGIPYLLFYNIPLITGTCVSTNAGFAVYYPSIYTLTLRCTIPVVIMIVFGYLAYRNIGLVRVLTEQQADRQLTKMILIEAVLVVISYVPYGVYNTYIVITGGINKDKDRINIENFASTMANLICYLYFSGSCYIFLISSSRFREAAKKRIFFWRERNDVHPMQ